MRISDWSSDVCSSDLGKASRSARHSSFSASVACRRNSRARNGVSAGRSWRLVRPSAFSLTRSEEHTSELQSLMRLSYAVFCLKKKTCERTRAPIRQKEKTAQHD